MKEIKWSTCVSFLHILYVILKIKFSIESNITKSYHDMSENHSMSLCMPCQALYMVLRINASMQIFTH